MLPPHPLFHPKRSPQIHSSCLDIARPLAVLGQPLLPPPKQGPSAFHCPHSTQSASLPRKGRWPLPFLKPSREGENGQGEPGTNQG